MTGRAAGLSRMPGIFRFRHGTGPFTRPAFFYQPVVNMLLPAGAPLPQSYHCLQLCPACGYTAACDYATACGHGPCLWACRRHLCPGVSHSQARAALPMPGVPAHPPKMPAVDYSARIKQRVSVKAPQRTRKSALRVRADQSVAGPAPRICPIRPQGILCR